MLSISSTCTSSSTAGVETQKRTLVSATKSKTKTAATTPAATATATEIPTATATATPLQVLSAELIEECNLFSTSTSTSTSPPSPAKENGHENVENDAYRDEDGDDNGDGSNEKCFGVCNILKRILNNDGKKYKAFTIQATAGGIGVLGRKAPTFSVALSIEQRRASSTIEQQQLQQQNQLQQPQHALKNENVNENVYPQQQQPQQQENEGMLNDLPKEESNTTIDNEKNPPPPKFTAFLTHNWGKDTSGRNNHQRVVNFKNRLQDIHNIQSLWLDEERMSGDVVHQMTSGIDGSALVIVFVTEQYIDKVAGRGERGDNDNCLLEFKYAARTKGTSKLIVVVMEDGCSDQRNWDGPIGFFLGDHLYYSFKDNSDLDRCAREVATEIERRLKE